VAVSQPTESRNRLTANGTLSEFSANIVKITTAISTALLADSLLDDDVLRVQDIAVVNVTSEGDPNSLSFTVVVFLGGPSAGSAAQIESRLISVIADKTLNTQLAAAGLALTITGSAAVCGEPPAAGKNQIRECSRSTPTKREIDTCSVQCVEGYNGVGPASFSCQNGGWSGNTYKCSPIEDSSSGMPLWVTVVLIVMGLLLLGAGVKIVMNYRENQEIKNYYQLKKGLIND
jgi:hypothetical protein